MAKSTVVKTYAVSNEDGCLYSCTIVKEVKGKVTVLFDDGDKQVVPKNRIFTSLKGVLTTKEGKYLGYNNSAELAEMTRPELKQYIVENELDIVVSKSMTEEQIIAKIIEAQIVATDEDEDTEETESDEEEEEEAETESESDEDEIDLDALSRKELISLIEENNFNIVVHKKMTDEDIRFAIQDYVEKMTTEETEEESDDEEETPAPAPKAKTKTPPPVEEDEEDEDPEPEPVKPPKKKNAPEPPKNAESKKSYIEDDDDTDDAPVSNSWYSEGDDDDDAYKSRSSTFDFWITEGKECTVTFLTNKPITFREHTIRVNGKYERYTCIANTGKRCPLCESGSKSYMAKAFYVIDHTEYTKKDGSKGKDNIRRAIFKQGSYSLLKAAIEEEYGSLNELGGFAGLQVKIKRVPSPGGKGSFTTGNMFFPKAKTALKKEWQTKTVDDLMEELKPLDVRILRQKSGLIDEDDD